MNSKEFYDTFKEPQGFKVPENFPIARKSTVYIKKRDRSEYMRKSGLFIAEGKDTVIPPEGTIYAVGELVTDLKPGMRVIFNFWANLLIYHDDIAYLMMNEIDVYGICADEGDVAKIISHPIQERKQLSYDELPDRTEKKEEKEERIATATMQAEELKHQATSFSVPVSGFDKPEENG